jgi:putative ABC transport system ATP-binding protein
VDLMTQRAFAKDEAHRSGRSAARVVDASKSFGSGDAAVKALRDVSVAFDAGVFTAIMGPSGSGKSTLLRRDRMGFVFQSFNLLPTLTAEENITLPCDLAGHAPDRRWLDTVVGTLKLEDRLSHKPSELSGGQQQRVAVARALVSRPDVVFADEPTGALDSRSSAELLVFLRAAVDDLGQTVVMVTHDPVAASYADRVVFLAVGTVVEELAEPTRDLILETMKRLGG